MTPGAKQRKIRKFFTSMKLAVLLLFLITIASFIGVLIPQNKPPDFYVQKYGLPTYAVFTLLGLTHVYRVWWFIFLLLMLGLSTFFCSLKRASIRTGDIFFQFTHWGVLVILLGAIIGGIRGEKGFIRLHEGEEVDHFTMGERVVELGFTIRLDGFSIERYHDDRKLLLLIDTQRETETAVEGDPGTRWEDPEGEYTITIERYVPDFSMDTETREVVSRTATPNNPALHVAVDRDGKTARRWIFARHAHFHGNENERLQLFFRYVEGEIKDYRSDLSVIEDGVVARRKTIEVNDPLKHGGYVFYQTDYDPEQAAWSGFQVKKDPGIPVVYAGFILLTAGLILQFYVRPVFLKRRKP